MYSSLWDDSRENFRQYALRHFLLSLLPLYPLWAARFIFEHLYDNLGQKDRLLPMAPRPVKCLTPYILFHQQNRTRLARHGMLCCKIPSTEEFQLNLNL